MPFDWVTANTGVFYRLGRLVKAVNAHLTNASTTLPAELKNIADPFELSDTTDIIDSLYGAYAGFQGQEVGNRQGIAGYSDRVLSHRDTVLEELGLTTDDINAILTAIIDRQFTDSQTVKRAVVTIGGVSAGAGNIGNGTVLTTKRLDGVTPPIVGGFTHLRYAGLDSELCVPSETMKAVCVADSYRNGVSAGSEQFTWQGGIADQQFGYLAEGSGDGPTLTGMAGISRVTDGSYENWTNAQTPTNWTVDLGAARISQETSIVYRGASAVRFLGDGSEATIRLSQPFTTNQIQARRMYLMTVRMRGSVAAPAAGQFEVKFTGTGYSPPASDTIIVPPASIPNTYTLYNAFVLMPSSIPSDFKLTVAVTGTLTNAVSVYFDALDLVEVPFHGGIGAVVVPGNVPFVLGDSFTWTVSQTATVFQEFFRRKYAAQLLSVGGGAETISDNLAQ